jgi:arginine N-succinyltransferase
MIVVRAIRKEDLDGLMYLATQVGDGMTTLKPDVTMLSNRIAVACASFAEQIPAEQRDYLFVMEDTDNGKIVGVSAIKSAVGLDEPFYNYRIGTLVHSSKELNVYSRMDTLYLSNDLTGCAELCSLFLHPDYRTGNNGKLLSKSRFLFIAQFPHLFSEKLIAELRGFQHADGSSPFWDNLGRHFFKMDFSRADDLSSLGKKSFIAELMPRHPLYVAYLPKEAQDVIGQVHVDTAPARRLLEQEGLYYEGFVDIFDAGPVLQARVNELRSVRTSTVVDVVDASPTPVAGTASQAMLVANTRIADYRIIASDVAPLNGQIQLNAQQQQALHCTAASAVRTMPLNAQHG